MHNVTILTYLFSSCFKFSLIQVQLYSSNDNSQAKILFDFTGYRKTLQKPG
jgi:hypothetical protein